MKSIRVPLFQVICFVVAAVLTATSTTAEVRVVASIMPVHSLVAGVMKGSGSPQLLVDGGQSPHTFSLKPSQARQLEDAQLVFWIGPDMETFLIKPLETIASQSRSVQLDSSEGLHMIDYRNLGTPHGDDGNGGHGNEKSGHPNNRDPHIWLDPQNAVALVRRIQRELVGADPENRSLYQGNADEMVVLLEMLISDTQGKLSALAGRKFMVFHDAYLHFEHRFGLESSGALYLNPNIVPGAARLREVQKKIVSSGVQCVFSEPQFDPKAWAAINDRIDVRLGVLDPVGRNLQPGPQLYFQLINDMAGSLLSCLGG